MTRSTDSPDEPGTDQPGTVPETVADSGPKMVEPRAVRLSFINTLERARALLQRHHRLSVRALQLEFALDADQLDALIDELVEVQQCVELHGKVLVWKPDAAEATAGQRGEPLRSQGGGSAADVVGTIAPRARSVTREAPAHGERRLLTVLFCDLVGSTDLSHRIDGEDYGEIMRGYHAAASAVIARFGGHVAQYLGDGLLVYFGYPIAGEDDPERAVRAGLAILTAVHELNPQFERRGKSALEVRVGIHTGPVVVSAMGDGSSPEMQAIGKAVNLAARLQGEARPDTVVVSPATLRLVQGLFLTRDLGSRTLKGIGEMHVHHVQRATGVRNRLDLDPARLTDLVGRDRELHMLLDQWRHAKDGDGRAVLVSGEAGLGKSRLLYALREHLADESHSMLACYCARDRQASAYYPLIELVGLGMGFEAGDTAEQKVRRIEDAARLTGLDTQEAVPLIGALLSLPVPKDYPALEYSAEIKHRKAIGALCSWVLALAAEQPLVMMVEDLHWCDPSTLQFLTLLVEQMPTAPALMLLSFRPELELTWPARAHVSRLQVGRLNGDQARQLVAAMTSDSPLPDQVVARIVARADGVPLFIEELTKMAVESGMTAARGAQIQFSETSIPETLQSSLLARLDRLGPARRIAQVGAVLGRRFPYALLHAVVHVSDDELLLSLRNLVDAELLHLRGTPPEAHYSFRHALIHDIAYQSLLRSDRRRIHADIARALEESFPERAVAEPEVLARHYDEAHLPEPAITHYRRAADRARRQFASEEALLHLRRALELLGTFPGSIDRDRSELGLLLALGVPLFIARGFANAEYGQRLERARELAERLDRPREVLQIVVSLYLHYQVAGQLTQAERWARHALELASPADNRADAVVARAGLSQALYLQGQFAAALEHFEQAVKAQQEVGSAQQEVGFAQLPLDEATRAATAPAQASGAAISNQPKAAPPLAAAAAGAGEPDLQQKPRVLRSGTPSLDLSSVGGVASALWGVRALCRWALGYPDQALALCETALQDARGHHSLFNLAAACIYAGWIHQKRGEREQALHAVTEACALSEHYGFSWLPWATVLRESLSVEPGAPPPQVDGSIAAIKTSIAALRSAGTQGWLPHCYSALAEVCLKSQRLEEALRAIQDGLDCAAATGQHYEDAELLRLRGESLAAAGATSDLAAAEAALHAAFETAREQAAHSLMLRAGTGLARVWQQQGQPSRALALLLPVRDAIGEGRDTTDWRDATALINALR